MSFLKSANTKKQEMSNSRINIISAIIFLIGIAIIFRLYIIQGAKGEYYLEVANNQHEVEGSIVADRGRIFLQDKNADSEETLYPVASNKSFANVYAVPLEIENPRLVSEQLYEVLDKLRVEEEVAEMIDNKEKSEINNEIKQFNELDEATFNKIKQELLDKYNVKISDKDYLETRDLEKEDEINLRKEFIIESYFKKLSKQGDPYEPIAQKVDEEMLSSLLNLNIKGIGYRMQNYRYYPEYQLISHVTGFCSNSADKTSGQYGLEGFFNEELSGKAGSLKAERDAWGGTIILNDMDFIQEINGSDLVLTIDRAVQYNVCTKLEAAVKKHGAELGVVIILDPDTGAILAMCSSPSYDPNRYEQETDVSIFNNPAIFYEYEPGSVFKAISMAAALDQGKVTPSTIYNDKGSIMIEGWPKPIKNSDFATAGGHGWTDMTEVLEKSLNTGAIFAMEQIGAEEFSRYVKSFGFGEKTGIELETEGSGNINNLLEKKIKPIDAAVASFGQGITVTSLQMVSAFNAIANGGKLMKPYLVKEIISPDGAKMNTTPKELQRVISERTSVILSGMLASVVESGHATYAKVPGYYVAGKTGTAQVASKDQKGYSDRTIHSFIGFAPVEEAKFTMIVMLEDPKDVNFSSSSAAPLFGDIAKFLLNYWQVPKER